MIARFTFALLLCMHSLWASAQEQDSLALMIQEIEASLTYQQGTIALEAGHGTLQVPEGFRFLDQAQA